MQGLHHRLEFVDGAGYWVPRLRGEKTDGVVPPVITQTSRDQMPVVNERMCWHELHRSDAQPREVIDHGRRPQRRISTPQCGGHVGMTECKSLYMYFVNDGAMPRCTRRPVCPPGECWIDHNSLQHAGRTIAAIV